MQLDPPQLRTGEVSGRVYVITHGRFLAGGKTLEATRKYDVTDQFDALAAARGWTTPNAFKELLLREIGNGLVDSLDLEHILDAASTSEDLALADQPDPPGEVLGREGGDSAPQIPAPKLTWQQRAALRGIGHEERNPGEDVCEATIALEGITPWKPCDNLVAKGLAEKTGWSGPEEGWCFVLPAEGRQRYQQLFEPDTTKEGTGGC